MIGWIVGRLRCFGGQHYRSTSKVRRPEGSERYESVCSYCGVPMERLAKRRWIVKKK